MVSAAFGGWSESQGFRRPPVLASCSVSIAKRPGVVHAISPDVRFGLLAFTHSTETSLRHPGYAKFSAPLDWHGRRPSSVLRNTKD